MPQHKHNGNGDQKRLLTVRELAAKMQVHPSTLYRMLAEGELRSIRLGKGGSHRFEWESVLRQLQEGE